MTPIEAGRIRILNDAEPDPEGRYVLYLLQQAQRSGFNPALEFAVDEANRLKLPVVACFGLLDGSTGFPEANARHYAFMLRGLADVAAGLRARGIGFVMRKCSPADIAADLAKDAALLVLDRGYLAVQRMWYRQILERAPGRIVQVEGEVVVPLEVASTKHEYGARTLRPKLHRQWNDYLNAVDARHVDHPADTLKMPSEIDVSDPDEVLESMDVDRSVPPVKRFLGGEVEARRRLKAYLSGPFADYGSGRGRPEAGAASHMSPYLHFGQISPVEVALAVQAAKKGQAEDREAYLEELIVRRELSMNHVFYTERYDSYENAIPDWARKTLDAHAGDERRHAYTDDDLIEGRTHDLHWNAAQAEMRETGYMHNHLRMYWGKKILEWSPSPEEGFARTLRINNRYFLDGRDPNSFTNVAWVYGLHDRPWAPHPIFGNVRYLSGNSLRKFNANAYVQTVHELCAAEVDPGARPGDDDR